MKQFLGKFIVFLGLIGTADGLAGSIRDCDTYEACGMSQTCECFISGTKAFNRYYYIDFSGFEKGFLYQCQLKGSILISLELRGSFFPQGVKTQAWREGLDAEILSLDTRDMDSFFAMKEKARVKYFIPGSSNGGFVFSGGCHKIP